MKGNSLLPETIVAVEDVPMERTSTDSGLFSPSSNSDLSFSFGPVNVKEQEQEQEQPQPTPIQPDTSFKTPKRNGLTPSKRFSMTPTTPCPPIPTLRRAIQQLTPLPLRPTTVSSSSLSVSSFSSFSSLPPNDHGASTSTLRSNATVLPPLTPRTRQSSQQTPETHINPTEYEKEFESVVRNLVLSEDDDDDHSEPSQSQSDHAKQCERDALHAQVVTARIQLSCCPDPIKRTRLEGRLEQLQNDIRLMDGTSEQDDQRHIRKELLGRLSLGKELGAGNFGKVLEGTDLHTGAKVAVKIIDKRKLDIHAHGKLLREVRIVREVNHPNIVRHDDIIKCDTRLYIIMEHASRGELFDYVLDNGKMSETQARVTFRQLVSAVEYLHRNDIVHRDLKMENMLLDSELNLKLADFGLSNKFVPGKKLDTFCGSPQYAAPELYEGKKYNGTKTDVWSMGVILYVMVTAVFPFSGENIKELRLRVLKGMYRIPYWMTQECEKLITKMLVLSPSKRSSVKSLMNDEWLCIGCQPLVPYFSVNKRDKSGHEIVKSISMYEDSEPTRKPRPPRPRLRPRRNSDGSGVVTSLPHIDGSSPNHPPPKTLQKKRSSGLLQKLKWFRFNSANGNDDTDNNNNNNNNNDDNNDDDNNNSNNNKAISNKPKSRRGGTNHHHHDATATLTPTTITNKHNLNNIDERECEDGHHHHDQSEDDSSADEGVAVHRLSSLNVNHSLA